MKTTIRGRFPARPGKHLPFLALLAALAGCEASSPSAVPPGNQTPTPPPDSTPPPDTVRVPKDSVVMVGAGSIASKGSDLRVRGVAADVELSARILDSLVALDSTTVVFTLGDHAYPDGHPDNYEKFYTPTWGRHRHRTRPALGSNDYARWEPAAGTSSTDSTSHCRRARSATTRRTGCSS